MSKIKLCKDCEHGASPPFDFGGSAFNDLVCRRSEKIEPVYGMSSFSRCADERAHAGQCGPMGLLWKPKCS